MVNLLCHRSRCSISCFLYFRLLWFACMGFFFFMMGWFLICEKLFSSPTLASLLIITFLFEHHSPLSFFLLQISWISILIGFDFRASRHHSRRLKSSNLVGLERYPYSGFWFVIPSFKSVWISPYRLLHFVNMCKTNVFKTEKIRTCRKLDAVSVALHMDRKKANV